MVKYPNYLQEDSAVMFQKMMYSLGLPVFYKKLGVNLRGASTLTTGPIVRLEKGSRNLNLI